MDSISRRGELGVVMFLLDNKDGADLLRRLYMRGLNNPYAIARVGSAIAIPCSSTRKGSFCPSTIIGMITAVKLPASINTGFCPPEIFITSPPLQASTARLRKAADTHTLVLIPLAVPSRILRPCPVSVSAEAIL